MNGTKRGRPWAIWPSGALCLLAFLLGSFFVLNWWPEDLVDKSDLIEVSGDIDTVRVLDDISGTSAGAVLPGMTSVYFTLEGHDGTFRYPFTHPSYLGVRDNTGVALDLLVDPSELGGESAATIWQLEERNPHKEPDEQIVVTYDQIMDRLTSADKAMVRLGSALLVASFMFLAIAMAIRHRNRRLREVSAG